MPNEQPAKRSGSEDAGRHGQTYDRAAAARRSGYQRQSIGEAMAKSFIRSIASSLGRILVRALTGGRR